MTANLSREFLWTDLNTMDEFFRLDPVNEVFFDTFVTLREKPFGVKLDAVKVFLLVLMSPIMHPTSRQTWAGTTAQSWYCRWLTGLLK